MDTIGMTANELKSLIHHNLIAMETAHGENLHDLIESTQDALDMYAVLVMHQGA